MEARDRTTRGHGTSAQRPDHQRPEGSGPEHGSPRAQGSEAEGQRASGKRAWVRTMRAHAPRSQWSEARTWESMSPEVRGQTISTNPSDEPRNQTIRARSQRSEVRPSEARGHAPGPWEPIGPVGRGETIGAHTIRAHGTWGQRSDHQSPSDQRSEVRPSEARRQEGMSPNQRQRMVMHGSERALTSDPTGVSTAHLDWTLAKSHRWCSGGRGPALHASSDGPFTCASLIKSDENAHGTRRQVRRKDERFARK